MGGQIHVDSEPGAGSCFSFEIPLGVVALGNASASAQIEAGDSPIRVASRHLSDAELAPLKGMSVLLVEDNKFNQQVAMDLLELVGVITDLAENGRQAIEKIQSKAFDVVLMDLQMPEMDGLTATRHIREELQNKTLPIIAMTANAMTGDRDRCLAAGMNAHIGKPIDPNVLYGELLSRRPQAVSIRAEAAASAQDSVTASERPQVSSATPVTDTAKLDLPGFDTELALSRMRGNVAHYKRMLGLFAGEFNSFPEKIQAAFADNDLATAKRLAHTLKGSAGTMGAMDVQTQAALLDKQLEAGELEAARLTFAALTTALLSALEKISALQANP
jgi:CheY-like chemotaxis protein